MDKHKNKLGKLEERFEGLPRFRRRDPEEMHPLDRRLHDIIGDLSFIPPGYWTAEEAEWVDSKPEYHALIQEYINTLD